MSPLHHVPLTAPSASPEKWLLFLHGIYGTGKNWRSFARRVVAARPRWGAVLLDLRMHGDSQGLPGPHTIAAAARDLDGLSSHVPGPVAGVLGHSFGGKVALRWVRERHGDLDTAWIIDSTPGVRPTARGSEGVLAVLGALREIGPVHRSREAFIDRLGALGVSRPLGQWLAMNLRQEGGSFRFPLDLGVMQELLSDYFRVDLWNVLEHPPGRVRLNLVIGGASEVFDQADRERALALADGRVRVHVLEQAGHFVHMDDPEGLFRLVAADLD